MTRSHGDYTGLAQDYARYRAAYAPAVCDALVGLASRGGELDAVDVGAGTGIWTRMLAQRRCRVRAVEPNADMFAFGQQHTVDLGVDWVQASAEDSGLADDSCDLLTMASSFHWTDFDVATAEFVRILRPGGVFAALWNTRQLDASPLLLEIEAELQRRVPHLKRVSSGRSAFCDGLTERLAGHFAEVLYLEGSHVERMSRERYLGLWRSVNDVRVQAGEATFDAFLHWIAHRIADLDAIDATYTTRAWAAR